MELTGSRDEIVLINLVADKVYRQIAQETGNSESAVHRMGLCTELSELLNIELRRIGFTSHLIETPRGAEYSHSHVGLDKDWRIDPSWQQYLPGGASYKLSGAYLPDMERRNPPKVLVVRTQNLPKVLSSWGLPARVHQIWTNTEIRRDDLVTK